MMRNKALFGCFALLMALCLVFTNVVPAFAITVDDLNGDDAIHYVSLGSEGTLGAYLEEGEAYPSLIADALTEEGKQVKLENLALPGMRVEELHMLLDSTYAGDDYTQWSNLAENNGGIEVLRAQFQAAVVNADVITLDLGANNFGSYVIQQIASNGTLFANDMSQLMSAEDLLTFNMYKSMAVAMIKDRWAMNPEMDLQMVVDTLAYALMGFQVHFDAAVAAIYELNPDVQLVVVGMQAPTTGVTYMDQNVDSLLGAAVDLSNLYTASQSPYALDYVYAYAAEGAETVAVDIQAEGVSGQYCYPSAAGHEQLVQIIESALENGTVGGAYYDPMMANLVGGLTGTDAKTPTEATNGVYFGGKNSYYVAIGDSSSAVGGFPELLAKELGVDHINLSQAGLFSADCAPILEANIDKLADADLVTLSFSVNTISDQIFANLKALVTGKGDLVEPDWSLYLDEESEEQIHLMLDDMRQDLLESGLDSKYPNKDITYADIMVMAIEHYLYHFIAHVHSYPELIDTIHAANPDALVVLVGMNNPMNGFELIYGESLIPLGEYLSFVVEATNTHYLLKAMTTENVIFVDAPEVKTVREANAEEDGEEVLNQMELLPFLVRSLSKLTAEYQTHADGHEYIKNQIVNALTEKILGDVNGDGKANNVDAMLILQHAVGFIGADQLNLDLADVNGDTKANNVDAMLILQHAVGFIDKFPIE